MYHKFLVTILIVFFATNLFSQDYFISGHLGNLNEKDIYYGKNNTLLRPVLGCEDYIYDSLIFKIGKDKSRNIFVRKLLYEHLIQYQDSRVSFFIDPVFDFRMNYNSITSKRNYQNTRGYSISGNLISKIYFTSSFYENQGNFPNHIMDFYINRNRIPGYGLVKINSDTTVFDFANAYGSIAFKPIKQLNFTFGYDRLFAGDGYRSMILSDFSAPYTFFKTTFKFGKFEYTNIFTKTFYEYLALPDLNNQTQIRYYPITFYNFLTYNLKDKLKITLVDGFIPYSYSSFNESTISTYSHYFMPYLSSLISLFLEGDFYYYLLGLNLTYQNPKLGVFYGQFGISSINDFNMALQLGYKSFDFLKIKNLFFQLEGNFVTKDYGKSFFHQKQSLMHPIGGNFWEILSIVSYSYKRFEILAKINYQQQIKDNFLPDNNYYYLYNMSTKSVIYLDGQLVYKINNTNKLQIFVGTTYRYCPNTINTKNTFFNFGLRTTLKSNYYDF